MSRQVVGSEPLYIMAEPARPDGPKGSSETETGASCAPTRCFPGHKEGEDGEGAGHGEQGGGKLPSRDFGTHYGVASCESCKAFFKRTIQGSIEYSCPASNGCEITKRRLKACQACRFTKLRLDRLRGEWQKYKRRPEVGPLPFPDPFPAGPLAVAGGPRKDSPSECAGVSSAALCRARPCCWAKSIPGFSLLSLSDQMSGLQSVCMELLVPGVAQLSLPLQDELAFAEDLVLDEEGARAAGLGKRGSALLQLVRRLQALWLEGEEYILLRALALASSNSVHVEDAKAVEQLPEALYEALLEYEAGQAGTGEGAEPRWAGRLLLTLPLLRQTAGKVLAHFCGVKLEVKVPMHKLFLKMLEAMMD
uniref:Nuclear receptor domain-containing protein n=1 Tax=Colobus angolensis palliatus TaxID=336983 RepID=A0A2K5IRI5_COLAP